MNGCNLEIWFGDEDGRATGYAQWAPTNLSFQDGNLWEGTSIDFRNPDEGIYVLSSTMSCIEGEEGKRYDLLGDEAMLVSPAELNRAILVAVSGKPVLERPAVGQEPDFECGLSRVIENAKNPTLSPYPEQATEATGRDEEPEIEDDLEEGDRADQSTDEETPAAN